MWPDGSFSLGFAKVKPDDAEPWMLPGATGDSQVDRYGLPLDLRNPSNSHRPPACELKWPHCELRPRGSKGMTALGRKMIKSAGALINNHPVFGLSTFATITIPPLTRDQRKLLVERWPELIRQLLQQVARQIVSQGLPPVVLSVTEVQPGRLREYGEAYPHLHLLWPNRKGARRGSWSVDVRKLREWFRSALERMLETPVEGHINIDIRPVRGSVAAYMSKYMSKGGECVSNSIKDWQGATIKQWWNLTATARKWVNKNKYSGYKTGLLLENMLFEAWQSDNFEPFIWLRNVDLPYDSGSVTVGWRGCLTGPAHKDVAGRLGAC